MKTLTLTLFLICSLVSNSQNFFIDSLEKGHFKVILGEEQMVSDTTLIDLSFPNIIEKFDNTITVRTGIYFENFYLDKKIDHQEDEEFIVNSFTALDELEIPCIFIIAHNKFYNTDLFVIFYNHSYRKYYTKISE